MTMLSPSAVVTYAPETVLLFVRGEPHETRPKTEGVGAVPPWR